MTEQKIDREYIYLSHFINESTPLYGGGKGIKIKSDTKICDGRSANTHNLSLPNHTGTHIDFPYHFSDLGKTINDYAPDFWFFTSPEIVDINVKPGELIDLTNEIAYLSNNTDFLLIRTGFEKYRHEEIYWQNNPGLHSDLAVALKKQCPNLKVIGMDFISVSSFQHREEGRETHRQFLLEHDVLLIEDMHLCDLNKKPTTLICLPLLIDKIDGVPITVVAEIKK